ncbi:MAG: YicC family protein [Flavobacteriaceae bacterium]|nr:YicC family protein [Flavobacteriaceae bacterium]|tara:strand:+ start:669 stop:1526 length:858 start_codon:yes stop_codon:yes gene_type:complete
MLHSMTGYGSTTLEINKFKFDIELKTLNSRYLDNNISLPNFLSSIEIEVGNILKKRLLRGKIELRVKSSSSDGNSVKFNQDVIKKYIKDLKNISEFDESNLLKSVINLPNSIDKPEIIITKSNLNNFYKAIDTVINNVISFRLKEGLNTEKDIKISIKEISNMSDKIIGLSSDHKKFLKDQLEKKSQEYNISIDKSRYEQEVFYYLEKIDINEELVRLDSHLKYFNDILKDKQIEKGKKLGFICQEIGREINTIGSKANNSKIQSFVVEMKSSLEKLKEQSLNIL